MSTLQDRIAADVQKAVTLTDMYFFTKLDYSEQSVQQLEDLFDDVQYSLPGGKSQENIEMLVAHWGSYVGEVLRQQCGGEWLWWQDQYGEVVALKLKQITVFPHEKVKKRLSNGSEENIWHYYETIRDIGEGKHSA